MRLNTDFSSNRPLGAEQISFEVRLFLPGLFFPREFTINTWGSTKMATCGGAGVNWPKQIQIG